MIIISNITKLKSYNDSSSIYEILFLCLIVLCIGFFLKMNYENYNNNLSEIDSKVVSLEIEIIENKS